MKERWHGDNGLKTTIPMIEYSKQDWQRFNKVVNQVNRHLTLELEEISLHTWTKN